MLTAKFWGLRSVEAKSACLDTRLTSIQLYRLRLLHMLCNSYTMDCPPVLGDNPLALASGLSYVQVDNHVITNLYHRHQCRHCTSRDISC